MAGKDEQQCREERSTRRSCVRLLRDAKAGHAAGRSVSQICQELAVSEKTYYRWKSRYASISKPELTRLKELEAENLRLKKLMADLSLDNAMLKELTEGNF